MKTKTARAPQHSDNRLNPYAIPLPRRAEYDIRNYEFFETLMQAKRERRLRIKRFKKALKADKYQDQLDEIKSVLQSLERCKKNNRCCSPVCPLCWRRHRINYVHQTLEFMDREGYTHFAFVTLINGEWNLPADALYELKASTIKSKIYYRLANSGFKGRFVALGFVDVEMREARWSGHIHLLIPYRQEDKDDIEGALDQLREDYYEPDMHPTLKLPPMHVKHRCLSELDHDDILRVTSYTMKRYWSLVKIIGSEKIRSRLPEPHFTDHLLWLHQCKLFDLRLVHAATVDRRIDQKL